MLVPSFISLVWCRHEARGLGRPDCFVAFYAAVYELLSNLIAVYVIFPFFVIHLISRAAVRIIFADANNFYWHVIEGVDQRVVVLNATAYTFFFLTVLLAVARGDFGLLIDGVVLVGEKVCCVWSRLLIGREYCCFNSVFIIVEQIRIFILPSFLLILVLVRHTASSCGRTGLEPSVAFVEVKFWTISKWIATLNDPFKIIFQGN